MEPWNIAQSISTRAADLEKKAGPGDRARSAVGTYAAKAAYKPEIDTALTKVKESIHPKTKVLILKPRGIPT